MNSINLGYGITPQQGIYGTTAQNGVKETGAAPEASAATAETADTFSASGAEAGQDVKKMMLSATAAADQTGEAGAVSGDSASAASLETASDVAGSLAPAPASTFLANIKNKLASAFKGIFGASKAQETTAPDQHTRIELDDETKGLTKAFGAIKESTAGMSPEEAEKTLQSAGEKCLDNFVTEMEMDGYMDRPAVKNSGMSLAQKVSLFAYTSWAYANINTALRTGDTERVDQMRPVIDKAVEALDKLPSHKGKVYRGAKMPQEFFDEHQPGAKVRYKAFTSTSEKSNLGTFKGNTELTIDCLPENSAGKGISELSLFQSESEVLFPPDTDFIVVSHTIKDGTHFIHMKELPKQNS